MGNEIEYLIVGQKVKIKPEVLDDEERTNGIVERIDGEKWGYVRYRNGDGDWFKIEELLKDDDNGQ